MCVTGWLPEAEATNTEYVWIADPLLVGGTHDTSSAPSAPSTVGAAIFSGTASIWTSGEAVDGSESPASLCATTVKECLTPFVRPVTSTPGSVVGKVRPLFTSITV